MKNKQTVFFVFLINLILSCSTDDQKNAFYQEENSSEFVQKASLNYTNCLELEADESTTSAMSGTDIFTDGKTGKKYLTFLSPSSKAILIYDLETKKCIQKVPLFDDGPNNTGPITTPSMHKLISLDSIIYFNFDHLYLLNKSGKILKKHTIVTADGREDQLKPNPGSYSPLIPVGDYIYILCSYNINIDNQSALNDIIKINYKTGEREEHFKRSTLYDDAFWGYNLNLYYLYGVYNTKDKEIILGYAAEPFLYSYNTLNDEYRKGNFIGSKHFKGITPFLDSRKDFKQKVSPELMARSAEHEITNPSYYAIFYDELNALYIRAAFLPRTKAEYYDPINRFKFKCSFIIFDDNFKKVGEEILQDASVLDFRLMFMLNGYLHIFNKAKYNKNNDKLYFDKFKLTIN